MIVYMHIYVYLCIHMCIWFRVQSAHETLRDRHLTWLYNRGIERQSVSHPASECLRGKDQTQEGRDPQGTDLHRGRPHRGRPTHRGSDPHEGRDPHRRHTDINFSRIRFNPFVSGPIRT